MKGQMTLNTPSTWSEEDEDMFKRALKYLKQSYYGEESVVSWLKSLKDRYSWKPSDEQMKQLKSAADIYPDSRLGHALKSLYQDLKKLRGE